jgi:hypothetical protein
MGLDNAIATLVIAKSLVALAPGVGSALAAVVEAGTELCKAAQVRESCAVTPKVATLSSVTESKDEYGAIRGARGARLAALLYARPRPSQTRAFSELRPHREDGGA